MRLQSNLNNIFGDYDAEVTPVPIPNTVVKLCSADDTWWEAAWESRSSPEHKKSKSYDLLFCVPFYSIPNNQATLTFSIFENSFIS